MLRFELSLPKIFVFLFLAIWSASLLNMASISIKYDESFFFIKHFVVFLLSCFAFFVGWRFDENFLRFSFFLWLISVFLLVLVDFLGRTKWGAERWLQLGPVSLQPTEPAKISTALYLSQLMRRKLNPLNLAKAFLVCAVPFYLVWKQPDVGSALTFAVIFFTAVFLWGISWKFVALSLLGILALTPFAWKYMLKDYHKKRILAVLGKGDPRDVAWQTVQSKLAVGSGGIWGYGFAQGKHTKLAFIPNLQTDFAFVSFAEDFGFGGSVILVLLYFILLLLLLLSCQNFSSIFSMLFAFHFFVNTFMVLGLLPVVGIPLPFFSLAGSCNVSFSLALGVALREIQRERQEKFKFVFGR